MAFPTSAGDGKWIGVVSFRRRSVPNSVTSAKTVVTCQIVASSDILRFLIIVWEPAQATVGAFLGIALSGCMFGNVVSLFELFPAMLSMYKPKGELVSWWLQPCSRWTSKAGSRRRQNARPAHLRLILRCVHDRRGAGMFADAAPNTILTLARSRDDSSGRPALQGPCRVDGLLSDVSNQLD
jgi:hypothetical protein